MDQVTARQTEEGEADSAMLTTTLNVRTKRVADLGHPTNGPARPVIKIIRRNKYVVKHKSAKLFMTYAVEKLEAALNISQLILSTSSQKVS